MKLNLHPKVIPKDAPPSPLTKGGVVVGMKKEGDKEKIYFIGDDCHLLCVGATRSGKSRCLVLESICLLGLAGESIFCSDPKAELFQYTSEFLKKLGYEVIHGSKALFGADLIWGSKGDGAIYKARFFGRSQVQEVAA